MRDTDAVKLQKLGPCDFMNRAMKWRSGNVSTILDLIGPLKAWSNFEYSEEIKFYAVLFVQLPLKTVSILPVRSYSAEHLYHTIRVYVNIKMQPCQLWVSDSGSNLSRFSTQNPGYEEYEEDQNAKVKAWQDLATGERGKDLENLGVFVRITSGDHKVVSSVEQAVWTTKKVLFSFDRSLKTPLTSYDWAFVFSEVSACVASRPLCATAEGRLYSAMSILSSLEQAGMYMGDDQVYVHLQGKEQVTARLEEMSRHLSELREMIAEILLVLMVKPSFIDVQVRREKIKLRDSETEVGLNDIFFCPRIFKKINNVTGSLLRLHKWGISRQIALFQKAGQLKNTSYVNRSLDQLFLVAKDKTNQVFGQEEWIPSWQIHHIKDSQLPLTPYLTWNLESDKIEVEEEEVEEDEEEGVERKEGEVGKEYLSENNNQIPLEKKTRSGRIIKKPQRYEQP